MTNSKGKKEDKKNGKQEDKKKRWQEGNDKRNKSLHAITILFKMSIMINQINGIAIKHRFKNGKRAL